MTRSISDVLNQVYRLEEADRGREAGQVIMLHLETLQFEGADYAIINRFLRTIDIEKLGTHSMTGMMRCTARRRSLYSAWKPTFEKCVERTTLLGRDPKTLWVGLLPKESPSQD